MELQEDMAEDKQFEKLVAPQAGPREYKINTPILILAIYYHIAATYALWLCFGAVKWQTVVFNVALLAPAGLGITAGAHRLWSHRAYKAKLPLQIILMLLNSMASQNTVWYWCRDHRLHHKHSDTDADPHNATRGFFYSHIGWLLVKRHPEVVRRGKALDLSDLYANPVLQFQNKYYLLLTAVLTFILPTLIPFYWQETATNAFHVSILRVVISFHGTFAVNSAAHKFGYKPYDRSILAAQNLFVSLIAYGEGFHNYHHVFPYDYRTAELGNNYLNLTSKFIDFFAWVGWAYDLKQPSDDMVVSRMGKSGDGTDLWGREDGENKKNK